MEHPLIETSRHTSVGCPDQYEGQLIDGRYFYYRYRWGTVSLGLGNTPDEAVWDQNEKTLDLGDSLRGVFESDRERDDAFATLLRERLTE